MELEGWCQAKITLASDYLNKVCKHMCEHDVEDEMGDEVEDVDDVESAEYTTFDKLKDLTK